MLDNDWEDDDDQEWTDRDQEILDQLKAEILDRNKPILHRTIKIPIKTRKRLPSKGFGRLP